MTTPVSFELARILQEKQIYISSAYYYINNYRNFKHDGKLYKNESGLEDTPENVLKYVLRNQTQPHLCSAPTIAEVIMLLYEKHDIWISASKYTKNGVQYWYTHYTTNAESQRAVQIQYGNPTKTVLEALEKGIKYVLENLI